MESSLVFDVLGGSRYIQYIPVYLGTTNPLGKALQHPTPLLRPICVMVFRPEPMRTIRETECLQAAHMVVPMSDL